VRVVVQAEDVDGPRRQGEQALAAHGGEVAAQLAVDVVPPAEERVEGEEAAVVGHVRVPLPGGVRARVELAGVDPDVPCARQQPAVQGARLGDGRQHVDEEVHEPLQSRVVGRPDGLVPAQEQRGERLVEERVLLHPRVAAGEGLRVPQVHLAEAGVGEPVGQPGRVARVVHEVDDGPEAVLVQVPQHLVRGGPVEHTLGLLDAMPPHGVAQPGDARA
jgi:hypothetical protein